MLNKIEAGIYTYNNLILIQSDAGWFIYGLGTAVEEKRFTTLPQAFSYARNIEAMA